MKTTYIALLRGINVGGKKPIKMADLRHLLTGTGLDNVLTYIQSGNIVFRSESDAATLQNQIHDVIQEKYGYDLPVLVCPSTEWKKMIKGNLMVDNHEIKTLHVTILADPTNDDQVQLMQDIENKDNVINVEGRYVYQYCPNGYSKTKLTNTKLEFITKSQATTRNWKSVLKIHELAEEIE